MAQQLLRKGVSKVLSSHPLLRCPSASPSLCHQTDISASVQQFVCMSVWEKDRKSGYRRGDNSEPKRKPMNIQSELKMLRSEMDMWAEEKPGKFRMNQGYLGVLHGDSECVWNFQDQGKVDMWTVTSDSDNKEGFSQAHLVFSKNKTAVFHGHLSKQVPQDGITKHSGYCNIRSPTKYMSFQREDVYDWSPFTHLLLRIRGDGRSYMLTISVEQVFDVLWHDQHHYVLFTHGGPYWQTAKIPFSKFYATSKGRIQDQQSPIQLEKVTHLGISIGDGNEGPFSLEIDSISVTFDENHEERFAYEL